VQRAVASVPAARKFALTLGVILAVNALPARHAFWGLLVLPALVGVARAAGLKLQSWLKRLLLAAPFLLSLGLLGLFQPQGGALFLAVLVKSTVSLLAVQLLLQTTPAAELLRTLRRARVPEILCSTILLLQRYWFLLADEAARMRRARAGRTLRAGRLELWRAQGNALGLLFVRTVSRAERVQTAMRARGAP
jgi:cobalt/nickel transport system permease protein